MTNPNWEKTIKLFVNARCHNQELAEKELLVLFRGYGEYLIGREVDLKDIRLLTKSVTDLDPETAEMVAEMVTVIGNETRKEQRERNDQLKDLITNDPEAKIRIRVREAGNMARRDKLKQDK